VSALCDPDPLSIAAARREFAPEAAVMPNCDELSASRVVDWVFVGSPNCHHSGHVLSALRAGKPVFCEKPLATTLDDCLAVAHAVKASGLPFAFGLVLRYSPLYSRLKELLEQGCIGRILSFEFNETLSYNHGGYIMGNWRRFRGTSGTHLLEKCCHDLDLANWLTESVPIYAASFGGLDFFRPENEKHAVRIGPDEQGRPAYQGWEDPHRVDPFRGERDIVDNQVAILQYASGARATFHTNCNAGLAERRFYLLGETGTLRADALTGVIELRGIGPRGENRRINVGEANSHAGGDPFLVKSLADIVLAGAKPRAGIDEALRSAIAAFGVDAALDSREVVDLRPLWKRAAINPGL